MKMTNPKLIKYMKMKDFIENVRFGTPIALFITLLASIVLVFISFFLPPKGQIDPSVIKATGELGIMASMFTFLMNLSSYIEAGHQVRLSKGDLKIEVNKQANDENNFEEIDDNDCDG